MALGSRLYCSQCKNPPPDNPGNNELANSSTRAPTKSSGSLIPTFHIFTPGSAHIAALTHAPIYIPMSIFASNRYTRKTSKRSQTYK